MDKPAKHLHDPKQMKTTRPQPDGFAGQRMFVLPEPLRSLARRHPLLRALHVTDAGFFPAASGHRIARPAGAPTTLLILCRAGRGWFRLAGREYRVGPGDLIWLPAQQPHAYGADAADPWTITWAHFGGQEVEAWRQLLAEAAGSADPLVALPAARLDAVVLEAAYAPLEGGHALREQIAAAVALRHSLYALVQLAAEHGTLRTASDRVAASVEKLRRDWRRPQRLDRLAAEAGMSVTHYSSLFRRRTGFSPIDFQIRLRVRHAGRLLDGTTLSIREVADEVGYSDPYYFSRCFRQVMGCSPRTYRKVPKG